uniref:Ubiquitin-like domain-containing protein n=1 Tax=Photinus pyralis TaxID=7054 RepID=A0A1Y1LQ82_PHOPY
MNELKVDNIIIQVRDKLQKDGIKLWLSPYYLPTGPSTCELERLAREYSSDLNIQYDCCYAAVSELQSIALEKLKQRDLYRASGIATLKMKILVQNVPPKLISRQICLKEMGQHLKRMVSETTNVPEESLKLIANGKVIEDSKSLFEQGVQNGQQILALTLNQSLTDLRETESRCQEIENVKADTQLLASDDNDYMELEDQAGNPVRIPAHERKALMVALALHEKGKSALKREDYSRALVFFLDADKEFR